MEQPAQNEQKPSKFTLSSLTFHKLDWLEYVTLGVGLWFLIFPKPYSILFTVLLLMPIVGLILSGMKGRPSIASLVEISKNKQGKDKYDVADFIDFAGWILLIRVLLDFEFESFYSLIIPGAIAFLLMVIILFATHKFIVQTSKSKLWIYSSILFNILIYSYAGTYGANCVYDFSEPKVYEAEVLEKRISTGKHTSYYIKVTPWGHHYDPEEITVNRDQYDEIRTGQTIKIDLKEGLFKIQWYYIE